MKQIYDWQEAALQKWEDNGFHGIFDVVTGAGKTCLAMFGIQRLKERLSVPMVVFVVVPTRVLMDQWVREIRAWFPEESVGRVGGGRKCSDQASFQVYIINTARQCLAARRDKLLAEGKAVLLIADECHHYGSRQNRLIFANSSVHARETCPSCAESARETCPPCAESARQTCPQMHVQMHAQIYTMGLSATPCCIWYEDVLKKHLGNCVFTYRHTEALQDKIISRFCLYQIGLNFHGEEAGQYFELSDRMAPLYARLLKFHPELKLLSKYAFFKRLRELALDIGDETAAAFYYLMLKRKDIVNQSKSRMECAIELIRQMDPSARIIVFTERITQADSFAELLKTELPVAFDKVHSGRSEEANRRALREFREGNLRILITCKVLDEGMDVPDADAAIVLSGTEVTRQHIQRLGRILRKSNAQKMAALYYLYLRESSESENFLPEQYLASMETRQDMNQFCNDRPDKDEFQKTQNELSPTQLFCYYYSEEHTFTNPWYEETAVTLLRRLKKKQLSEKTEKELRRCIVQGLMRPDWLRMPEECEKRASEDPASENYWLAAKMMAGQRMRLTKEKQDIHKAKQEIYKVKQEIQKGEMRNEL